MSVLLADLVLERLAGLEDGNGGRGNFDGLFRLGVTTHTRLARFGLEAAEADQLDLVARTQNLGDVSNVALTDFSASFLLMPHFFATSAINSVLFMTVPLFQSLFQF